MPPMRARVIHIVFACIVVALLSVAVQFLYRYSSFPEAALYEPSQSKKRYFVEMMLPYIKEANQEILRQRKRLTVLYSRRQNNQTIPLYEYQWLERVAEKYEIPHFMPENDNHWKSLLRRVNVVPPSLTLAQAAVESGWGASRFALVGNNYFGVRCYEIDCGLIPERRKKGEYYEVKIYESPLESIRHYMYNLNTHPAYRVFRSVREATPFSINAMADSLERYSEIGKKYSIILKKVVKQNTFERFDKALLYQKTSFLLHVLG